jgi:UDP-2,3-diacylglucosamine hydrolase
MVSSTEALLTESRGEVMTDLAWCAADPHFARGDAALETFHRWLGAFRTGGASTLVLLGDLFEVWIGLPSVQTEDQRTVLEALRQITSEGRRVVYLRGNRDYFIEEPLAESGVLLHDQWDMQTPGGCVRFEHGDLINTSDRNYLRWREVSRSGTVSGLFRLLPASRQQALAERLERSLGKTNAYFKAYRPDEELRRWAEGLRAEGVATAVLGHFHVDEAVEVAGVQVRFVPQFRTGGEHVRIGSDGTVGLHRFGGA